jgi:hypothetical protein
MGRAPFGLVLLALLVVARPAAAVLDSDLGSATLGGGCYPTPIQPGLFDMLVLVNPEWAPVVDGMTVDSTPVVIHGDVLDMHGDLSGDFPATHVRADVNVFMALDPADQGTIATGNDGGEGHLEWEAGVYPAWAWPGPGDRMVAMGRLIFDCGHPGGDPGTCSVSTGQQCVLDTDCRPPVCATCGALETCVGKHFEYGSELHPPQTTAVIRRGRGGLLSKRPSATPVPVTKVDIYASAAGGGAGDRCILTHHASPLDLLSVSCFPLSQPVAPLNAQDFSFDVPLPPRPQHGPIRFRKIVYPAPGGGRSAHMRVRRQMLPEPHLEVTVFLAHPKRRPPTGFAGTILAGWRHDPTPLVHVRTTVTAAVIQNALQPVVPVAPRTCSVSDTPCATSDDCPSGEECFGAGPVPSWNLQAAVNGEWQELAGLDTVSTGDVVPETLVYDQYLPPDGAVHLVADGAAHECVDTMYGKSLATGLAALGFTKGLACLNSTAHRPGTIDVSYLGPDFGAGPSGTATYDTVSTGGDGGHCSASTSVACLGNADCPTMVETCVPTGGAFALRYRIERLS